MLDFALSLMALSVLALAGGAIFLLRRGGTKKQALLMLVLAAIMAVNIGIWTLPDSKGAALVEQAK